MKTTLSVIKADIGSIGGHIAPSRRLVQRVAETVEASGKQIITDHYISHTGDDVAILMTHTRGVGDEKVHKLAWEAFTPLGKPMGAVINRAGLGNDAIYRFCQEKGLPILAEIPYDRAIAEAYSRGRVIAALSPGLEATFVRLRDLSRDLAQPGRSREAARA